MTRTRRTRPSHRRQLMTIATVLPMGVLLSVLAFAWPAARVAPRDLPVGVVGSGHAVRQVADVLHGSRSGAFDLRAYSSEAAARAAVEDRNVYGAFVVDGSALTLLEASAAGPSVVQELTATASELSAALAPTGPGTRRSRAVRLSTVDVVPTSVDDPRELILSSSLLPLTIVSIVIAAAVAIFSGFRPAWRQVVALLIVSGLASVAVYLVAETYLGALPHNHLQTCAALAMTILAISSTATGLVAILGSPGLGMMAGLMVFVGNPFSGVTTAPQLLPAVVGRVGQWLPPGAGASLVRSTAYFHGHGSAGHWVVLAVWSVLGVAATFVGHHTSVRFAAHPDRSSAPLVTVDAG